MEAEPPTCGWYLEHRFQRAILRVFKVHVRFRECTHFARTPGPSLSFGLISRGRTSALKTTDCWAFVEIGVYDHWCIGLRLRNHNTCGFCSWNRWFIESSERYTTLPTGVSFVQPYLSTCISPTTYVQLGLAEREKQTDRLDQTRHRQAGRKTARYRQKSGIAVFFRLGRFDGLPRI